MLHPFWHMQGLRCMRHADVDAQYDFTHSDSNEVKDIHTKILAAGFKQ